MVTPFWAIPAPAAPNLTVKLNAAQLAEALIALPEHRKVSPRWSFAQVTRALGITDVRQEGAWGALTVDKAQLVGLALMLKRELKRDDEAADEVTFVVELDTIQNPTGRYYIPAALFFSGPGFSGRIFAASDELTPAEIHRQKLAKEQAEEDRRIARLEAKYKKKNGRR